MLQNAIEGKGIIITKENMDKVIVDTQLDLVKALLKLNSCKKISNQMVVEIARSLGINHLLPDDWYCKHEV